MIQIQKYEHMKQLDVVLKYFYKRNAVSRNAV